MLFRQDILRGIAEGRVTLAFRRWRRPPPRAGSRLRTPVGVLSLERVAVVTPEDITPSDVERTGLSVDELRTSIDGEGTLLRIELRYAGEDPRAELRQQLPDGEDVEMLRARLARMDAASPAPWTTRFLRLIGERPAVGARELARSSDLELPLFKRRVRRLKELGLTESLEIGYRLSPRGSALLAGLGVD